MAENTETNARFELQLYRNADLFESLELAVEGLKGLTLKGGEPALAIYKDEKGVEKLLLGIKGKDGIHILEGATLTADNKVEVPEAVQAAIAEIAGKINTLTGNEETDGSVAKSIKDAVAELKNTDAEVGGQFVTEVKEENGVVAVKRAAVVADKVTAEAIPAGDATVAVTGTDVAAQIASLAGTLKTVEKNAAKYEVVKLTDEEIQALTDDDKANIKDAYKVISYTGDFETAADKVQVGATIKIYKDGNLKNAELGTGEDAQKLVLTYTKADGTDATVKVDFKAIAFNTEFKDGLVVDESGEVKVKLADGSQEYLKVGADGLKLEGVQGVIADVADTEVAGQYVKTVSQTDGKIAVERADVAAATLNGYEKGEDATAVAATDTINKAFGKLENQVAAAKGSVTTEIEKLDATVVSTEGNDYKVKVEIVETDGKLTSVTVTEQDIASAAEVATLKGADTVEGSVAKSIKDAIEALDVTDTAEGGKFVTAVSEADGKIAVTRGEVAAEYVTLETVGEKGEDENKISLAATNVQDFAQEIFEKTIENEQVAANAINSVVGVLGADTAKVGDEVKFNTTKFADNEILNGATSFADADMKLAAAIKAIQTSILTIDCGEY